MKIGCLTAMKEEAAILIERRGLQQSGTMYEITLYEGSWAGHEIILMHTRIGKVAATIATTLLFDRYRPDLIINIGIAGNARPDTYQIGDVVMPRAVQQHDVYLPFDGAHLSYVRDALTRSYSPRLAQAIMQTAGSFSTTKKTIHTTGTLVTGDQFVDDADRVALLRDEYAADVIDMEGAAIASVCAAALCHSDTRPSLPLLLIKGISDNANDTAATDHETNLALAMTHCADVASSVIQRC